MPKGGGRRAAGTVLRSGLKPRPMSAEAGAVGRIWGCAGQRGPHQGGSPPGLSHGLLPTPLQPPALSLGGRFCPPPTPLPNQAHWPRGPGAWPTGTCYWGLPLNQVKGWGARRGLASKGSDFLPLTLLFDPLLERLIYRNQWFHRGLLSGFCCFQDA